MKKFLNNVFSRRVLMIIQLIISLVFVITLGINKLLPAKYFYAIGVVLIILPFIFYRTQKRREYRHANGKVEKKTVGINIISKVIQVVVCFLLIMGEYYVGATSSFLNHISGSTTTKIKYSVVVMKNDLAKSIEDTKDYNFGYLTSNDTNENTRVNQILAKINNDLDTTISPTTYDTQTDILTALYAGTTKAIVINDSDRDSYKSVKKNFSKDTRVIKNYYIVIKTDAADRADVVNEPFTIFVSGIDTYGSIDTASLSDVNMVVTINPKTKQVLLTSIPRDYYIDIAGTSGKDKLTHSAKNGISCTEESIENLLGININYYAKLNYTTFMKVIDAIGGIDINNTYGEFTTRIGFYKIKEGWNHLNAKQALGFVRERHSFANGDRVRMQNQQLMIKAIAKKITKPSTVTKIPAVFAAIQDSMETNMSSSDITSLINMEIDDMATWDIQSYHLNGSNLRTSDLVLVKAPRGLYVMDPDQETINQAKTYIDDVMNSKIVKVTKAADEENITADPTANDKYR